VHSRPADDARATLPPTGPRMAGQHGVGLLSIGATLTKEGLDALAHHWNVVEERAAHYGQTANRRDWRLVGLMHIAETREQAYREVEYGIAAWFRYFQKVAAFPQMAVEGGDVKEMIDFINEAGQRRHRHRRRPRTGTAAVGPVRRPRLHAVATMTERYQQEVASEKQS
jgi:alkanesulfonate monooxygenase SsuD/methylene tetrahydromethanopterin reductase-like flavin-dependent oxidoreductase (luciferase family)